MNFSKYAEDLCLNDSSEFSKLAQAAIENYYVIPYPNEKDKRPHQVNRLFHGALHVCMAARHADLFIAMYQKYKPELLTNERGQPLSAREIKLIKLSVIYHDSANTSETFHNEAEHAERFTEDMLILGFRSEEIAPLAHAIVHKDAINRETKTIYQKILHDADCLEIIRIVGEMFRKEELDAFLDLNENPDFLTELEEIIQNQIETSLFFKSTNQSLVGPLHIDCEYAENCYDKYCELEHSFLLNNIILRALAEGLDICEHDISTEHLSILDLYNRNRFASLFNFGAISCPIEQSEPECAQQSELMVEKFHKDGVFIRTITETQINQELKTLSQNAIALERAQITNATEMRSYLEEQKTISKDTVLTPDGFKWRPCTFVMKDIPISLFGNNKIGVIINPEYTTPVYFYKQNAVSKKAITGKFEYTPEKGGLKDKGSLFNFKEKLIEMEMRRRGNLLDLNYNYYGRRAFIHNEILTHYSTNSIFGILVGDRKEDIQNALILRSKLGKPMRPLFKYSTEGLSPFPLKEAIKQISLISHKKEKIEIYLEKRSPEIKTIATLSPITKINKTFQYSATNTSKSITEISQRELYIATDKLNPRTVNSIRNLTTPLARKYGIEKSTDGDVFAQSVKTTTMFEWQEVDSVIIMNFSGSEFFLDSLNNLITDTLEKIDNIILSPHPEYYQLLLLDNINLIEEVGEISRKTNEQGIVIYSFENPIDAEKTCSMQMKDNQPLISIIASDGITLSKPTNFLSGIAKKYFKQISDKINLTLLNETIINQLKTINVTNLTFEFNIYAHYHLNIQFTIDNVSRGDEIHALLTFLDIDTPIKIIKTDPCNPQNISFMIKNLDLLEYIHTKLNQITEENIDAMRFRYK